MIIDITGVVLTPGNFGNECMGNGNHYDLNGFPIACCCDECDYFICCTDPQWEQQCKICADPDCPRHKGTQTKSSGI